MKRRLVLILSGLLTLVLGLGLASASSANTAKNSSTTASRKISSPTPTPVANVYVVEKIDSTEQSPTIDPVTEMMQQVNRDRVLQDLRQLTGKEPICTTQGCYPVIDRLTGGQGLHWALDYLYETLIQLGYSMEWQEWALAGYADRNLIARRPGIESAGEEIYFIAHVDGVSRSPAADDNASGVVSILELARILRSYEFRNTVVLIFSTGEEQGTLGIRSYVDHLSPEELSAISYVVNVEMLGYDADHDEVIQLWSGDHPESLVFAQMLSGIIRTYGLDLAPRVISGCT